jgi:uncharacterized protein (TIGR03545 family)
MTGWKRLAIKLGALAVVAVLVCFAVNAHLRRALISAGESATGAKMEIGRLDSSLIVGQVTLGDVRFADPDEQTRNLLQIGEVSLDLETSALWKRKLVAGAASLTGVRIGTPRATSAALPERRDEVAGAPACCRLTQLDEPWVRDGAEALWHDVAAQSESLRLIEGLAGQWPGRIEQLGARAATLAERAATAQQALEQDDNVLRRRENLSQAAGELKAIRKEAEQLNTEMERLAREAPADREALASALARDQERLAESFRLDPLEPDVLSQYLLGPEVGRRVETLLGWLRWVRKLSPAQAPAPGPDGGVEVAADQPGTLPDFLIRGATLSGEGELLGRAVRFQGYAWGITSQPKRYGGPSFFDVQTTGGVEVRIRAGVDRTGPVPRERLVVDCPQLPHEHLTLGNPEQLALTAAPDTMRLGVLLDTRGDAICGQITLDQDTPLSDAKLGPDFTNPRLARRLEAAFAGVERVSATVRLGGTLDRPRWQLQTDLGPRLARALERALREELAARRAELAARLDRHVEEQLAAYEQLVGAKHEQVAEHLRLGDEHVREGREIVARRSGVPKQARRKDSMIQVLVR